MPIEPPRPYDPFAPRKLNPPDLSEQQIAIIEQLLDGPRLAGTLKAPAKDLVKRGLAMVIKDQIFATVMGINLYHKITGEPRRQTM